MGDPNLLRSGEPAGTRTQGPRLKRAMLYRLSYRLNPIRKDAKRMLSPRRDACQPHRRDPVCGEDRFLRGWLMRIVSWRLVPVETRSIWQPVNSSTRSR